MPKNGRPASQLFRVLGAVLRSGGIAGRGPDECWPWDGAPFYGQLSRAGYGEIVVPFRDGGGRQHAHLVAWRWANETRVPAGCEVDHLCRLRSCVNPHHLQAVDQYGNSKRQLLTPAQHRALGDDHFGAAGPDS